MGGGTVGSGLVDVVDNRASTGGFADFWLVWGGSMGVESLKTVKVRDAIVEKIGRLKLGCMCVGL